MQYDKKELDVAADCTQVELTLTHTGKLPAAAMGHNWVLVKTADVTAVANAGMSAGLANNYLTPNDPRVIASTKIIGGGQSTTVTFPTVQADQGRRLHLHVHVPGSLRDHEGRIQVRLMRIGMDQRSLICWPCSSWRRLRSTCFAAKAAI